MEHTLSKSLLLVVVAIMVVLAITSAANAHGPLANDGHTDKGWSALDNVGKFKETLDNEGFDLLQGGIEYVDLVQACCLGQAPDTLANNPWPNAYVTLKFDPHPGVSSPVCC